MEYFTMNGLIQEYGVGCQDVIQPEEAVMHRPPEAKRIDQLLRPINDDENELLKHRFLCRGGGLLLVGPTGVGKSSYSMQCMLTWALGQSVFDIAPARPLKSLLIQAENDDGDLAEMRDGVVNGLDLSPEDSAKAFENIFVYREDAKTGDTFFSDTVKPLLESQKPDLLWIDPALSYLGGDTSSQEDVSRFLRTNLNPLIHEHNCGVVIVHHTNKPLRDIGNKGWSNSDYAYAGAGSAEWANWARAVLALKTTPQPSMYELVAGKRGSRLNWKEADGNKAYSKYIAHAKGEGKIYWRAALDEEIENLENPIKNKRYTDEFAVLSMISPSHSIEKNQLIKLLAGKIGENTVRKIVNRLIVEGKIHEVQVPRKGSRAAIHLSIGPGDGIETHVNDLGCSQPAVNIINNSDKAPQARSMPPVYMPENSMTPRFEGPGIHN
jgi:hypothetical protein